MTDERGFVDSNIWIYAVTQSEAIPPNPRHEAAKVLIRTIQPYISVQVINEVSYNLVKKFKFTESDIQTLVKSFYRTYTVCPMMDEVLLLEASSIRQRYNISFWDSMLVSTAIQSQCSLFYTEDMRHGLIVNDVLTIVNPFA
ncbi:PIN domain-containing protein [Phormidium sp. FACHB-1136]|uniref:PIN domain-containing protein n=1 Tax=Phormidium sp. FACHB-1136 TaxID=2692848 RepID=UPI001688F555|nr:PIN domain-containing protein [Phormidium sp. FACHB-1136]MBD2425332.1 PIN domain-containing protein [Phormidium sp. FACHB-1136]